MPGATSPDGANLTGSTITLGGVPASVFCDGYRKGNSREGGPWRTIVYQIDSAAGGGDSDKFMDSLMGITTSAGGIGGRIGFPLPHAYPGNTRLLCEEVNAENRSALYPDSAKLAGADVWHVYATYRVPRYDVPGTDNPNAFGEQSAPWGRYEARGFVEEYPMETSSLAYQNHPDDQVIRKFLVRVPIKEMTVTRSQIPYLADDLIDGVVGQINASEFMGKPRGTVLFDSYDTNREPTGDGSIAQEYVFRLRYRPQDWNKDLLPEVIAWDYVVDGSGNMNYTYGELNVLNTIGQ